ncbi:tyrosine-protein phosphatase [Nonomuraea sp. NPDC050790]|uniref:tyrosine-protein phosphatase n=1 Tax=Nonomuraea sp. NPDC050790 TaxID=3364371 RepID=UPI0037914C6E
MIRHIEFANIHNFRDVGGYVAHDGRSVRWQRLYRADSLSWLAGPDLDTFRALKVRTVIDLRHPSEVERRGRVPEAEGLRYHNLPVEGRKWDLDTFDPSTGVERFLADRYLEVSEDGVPLLRSAIETIADADNAPVVIHCAAGKDRTGILIALVLSLAGVSPTDIVADYALTALATPRFVADWQTKHRDSLMWAGFGAAPAGAMTIFLAEMERRHGSLPQYCSNVLEVEPETVTKLRAHLLTEEISRG